MKPDVVIVGARCAGAATALLLARSGLNVVVVDRGQYGTDTLSTHALMRGGVLQLNRWGVLGLVKAAGTPAVRAVGFHYGDDVVTIPIKPRDGVDALYAPRRDLLDRLLVNLAADAGAEFGFGYRLVRLLRGPGERVRGVVVSDGRRGTRRIEAGLVIGADGMRSTLARLVGSAVYRTARHAACCVYAHWPDLDIEGYQWHYRPGVSAGAIPTNDGRTCVFVARPAAEFHRTFGSSVAGGYQETLKQAAPDIEAIVAGRRPVGNMHGFSGEPGFIRQSWGPGWALVGDAGYYKDPITAHGITDALRDAELLADAIVAGSETAMSTYQRMRDEIAGGLFDVTDAIASFDWDLESVRAMHEAASREMSNEVKIMAQTMGRLPDGRRSSEPGSEPTAKVSPLPADSLPPAYSRC